MRVRLPVRLFAAHAVVVAVGALTAYVTVRLLVPRLFDSQMSHMGGQGGMGMGSGSAGDGSVHSALVSALDSALLVAVLVSAVAAGAAAVFVTARLLRPLDAVRAATRSIAAGDYAVRVPEPDEPELAALADDVNTLAGTLAESDRRRVRLLGDVAHEMRTPLTALDGYVEGMVDGVFAATPQNLQAMGEELHRLHRLADDLSSLSRAEEHRLDLRPVPADLAEVARAAAERLRPQFEDAGVSLEVVPARGPVPVRVDVDRVSQVLTNLLGNALVATSGRDRVTVTASAGGGVGSVTVTDSGVGLAADDVERVFERFYRAPNRQRRSPGSGVGLTIARGIARAHGGDLTARSGGPGRGSSFTLTLPLVAAADDSGRAAASTSGPHPT